MHQIPFETTLERRMLARAAQLGLPLNGSLELLPLCNMNCSMCYIRLSREEMEQRGRLRTADEWLQLAGQMRDAGVLFLLLTGGEPLLFPDFRRLFRSLKEMGMILTINTNGTLLDEDWARFFGSCKPRRVNITLYGANEDAYASLCHYPGGFAKTLRAIRLLKEQGVDVKISASVTRDNLRDLDELYRIGRELGAPVTPDTYMLPGLHERGLPFAQQARLEPEQAAQAQWTVIRQEIPAEFLADYVRGKLRLTDAAAQYPDGITCMAGNCSFAVNWQGEMRPCVTLEEPSAPVFEVGFAQAWKQVSAGCKAFRLHPGCTVCRLRPLCRTCVGSAWLETGSYNAKPDYLCRYAAELERLLRQYTGSLAE